MSVDPASRIIQLVKLPLKQIGIVAIASGVLLFSPHRLLVRMKADAFVNNYGTWISIVFVLSATSVVVNAIHWAWQARARSAKRAADELRRLDYLQRLSDQEKSVLREFYIQGQNTLRLPINHPTVTGLLRNGILVQLDSLCEGSLAGFLAPVAISNELPEPLVVAHIDLPREPVSEADRVYVLSNRPDFMPEIEHHNEIFHTSWRRSTF